jgi:hypothetical protein
MSMTLEVTSYPSVVDRVTAALLRERYLERPLNGGGEPITIDLNGMERLSVEAADELVAKFVERVRARQEPTIVFVLAKRWEVLRAIHAALRDRRQAALAVNVAEGAGVVPVGDVSGDEREAFQDRSNGQDVSVEVLRTLADKGLLTEDYLVPTPGAPAEAYAHAL